jgi:hypothetical protein
MAGKQRQTGMMLPRGKGSQELLARPPEVGRRCARDLPSELPTGTALLWLEFALLVSRIVGNRFLLF